jgi:hypothetical protein
VAVGDAENDHALCKACEASAAVANALPTLKDAVDIALDNHHGAGVEELIHRVLQDDLQSIEPRLTRHHLPLGRASDGREVLLPPYGVNLLITGPRGGGKSSLAALRCSIDWPRASTSSASSIRTAAISILSMRHPSDINRSRSI